LWPSYNLALVRFPPGRLAHVPVPRRRDAIAPNSTAADLLARRSSSLERLVVNHGPPAALSLSRPEARSTIVLWSMTDLTTATPRRAGRHPSPPLVLTVLPP